MRLALTAMLLFASVLISGAHKGEFVLSISEKEKIEAAELLVSGTGEEKSEWQSYAAANPMLFLTIETGNL